MPRVRLPLIVHERLGQWARQLRPRVASWPVRLIETRSASDLRAALGPGVGRLVVLDLGRQPARALDDLARCHDTARDALVLALDPSGSAEIASVARALGVTAWLPGPVPPPEVAALLERWLPLARHRAQADGWGAPPPAEPEPWEALLGLEPA